MKTYFERFIRVCLFILSLTAAAEAHAQTRTITLVVFGDSLTSGYELSADEAFPAKLEHKLRDAGFSNVRVANMSVAGETTSGGLERIDTVITQRPDIVMLELGSNDALRGLPPVQIYNNLAAIINKLQQASITVILAGAKAPPNMGYSYGAQLDAGFKRLGSVQGVYFYPFILQGVVGQPELNLADSIHPNTKGIDTMIAGIYNIVDAALRAKWTELEYKEQYQYQQQLQANPQMGAPAP
jgi:acyl-CoA thioesterase-1